MSKQQDEIKELKTKLNTLEYENDRLSKVEEEHKKLNGELRAKTTQLEKELDKATSELNGYAKRKMEAIKILNDIPMNSSNCVYKMKIDKAILVLIGADEE